MKRHLRTAAQWLGLLADPEPARHSRAFWLAEVVLTALGWWLFGFWGAVAGIGIVGVVAVFYPREKATQPSDD